METVQLNLAAIEIALSRFVDNFESLEELTRDQESVRENAEGFLYSLQDFIFDWGRCTVTLPKTSEGVVFLIECGIIDEKGNIL